MSDCDEFMECASCKAKPGSPTLCTACLHNRTLASQLRRALDREEMKDATIADLKSRLGAVRGARDGAWVKTPTDPKCSACGGSGRVDTSYENGHNGDWEERTETCKCSGYYDSNGEKTIERVTDLRRKNWKKP